MKTSWQPFHLFYQLGDYDLHHNEVLNLLEILKKHFSEISEIFTCVSYSSELTSNYDSKQRRNVWIGLFKQSFK